MKALLTKYYGLIPVVLLCVFCTYKAIDFPIHDFSNYYFGGKFLANDQFNSDIYFPYQFNKAIFDSGYPEIFVSYAPNTPFLAVFFISFSVFPLVVAKLVFNGISVVLLVLSLYRLFNYYRIDPKYTLLIPILFLVPIKNNLLFGQVYFLLFFLLAEGWLAYEKKHFKSMAFFWSLAILLKIFPVLLIALLLFKKQVKPFLFLTFFCGLLFGISVLFTGFDIWFFYIKEVLPKASNGEIVSAYVDNYQSVFMFLKRLLVFDMMENPKAFFNAPVLFPALLFAFKIGVLIIGYFIAKKNSNALFVFSYWILAMILLSPYGSTYTLILLLFTFLTLCKSDISMLKKIIFFSLLFLINNLPLSFFLKNQFPFSYLRLFVLLLFLGFIIALAYENIQWKTMALVSLIPVTLIILFQKQQSENSNLLIPKLPTLIYDYQIENNQLTYFYWNAKGENKAVFSLENGASKFLEIRNNQIYDNQKQLTFDKSNKLKPILINGKILIYLSDFERGIGFYTLRKIELDVP